MADKAENEARERAKVSLVRMQDFDVQTLPREAELGRSYSFRAAVEPASRLVELFKRLSPEALSDFSRNQLEQVQQQSDASFNLLNSVLQFDATQGSANDIRQSLIQNIEGSYQDVFDVLHPLIGYSLHKSADFQRLDSEARATLQKIKDDATEITRNLEQQKLVIRAKRNQNRSSETV